MLVFVSVAFGFFFVVSAAFMARASWRTGGSKRVVVSLVVVAICMFGLGFFCWLTRYRTKVLSWLLAWSGVTHSVVAGALTVCAVPLAV
jgi:hypothetical protein